MVTRALGISSAGTSGAAGEVVADYPHFMLLNEDLVNSTDEVDPQGKLVRSTQTASNVPVLVRSGKQSLKLVFSDGAAGAAGFENKNAFTSAKRNWTGMTYLGFMWYGAGDGDSTLRITITNSDNETAYLDVDEDWTGWRFVQANLVADFTEGTHGWTAMTKTHIEYVRVVIRATDYSEGTRYFDRLMVGKPYELVPVPRFDRQLIMSAAFEGKATHYQGFKKPIVDHGNNEQRIIITGEFLDSIVGEWDHNSKKEQRFDRLFDFLQYTGGVTGSRRWFVLWWYGRCFDVTFHSLTSPWRSGENNIPYNLTIVETTGI